MQLGFGACEANRAVLSRATVAFGEWDLSLTNKLSALHPLRCHSLLREQRWNRRPRPGGYNPTPLHLVVPCLTKTQSSGEGCKILLSESIRERAAFNGVRGSRRHRASGALDPVKLSSPLLHGVGPSTRSACAAARSQQHRRRAQPVDSTPAQACSIRRSQPHSNAVAGPDGARSMSCASALP